MKKSELFKFIHDGYTLLTPNRRLCTHLQREYAHFQESNGVYIWETPKILPISQWLHELWEYHFDQGLTDSWLLNDLQRSAIWKKIISDSEYGEFLLNIDATIDSVADAYQLLKNWQISSDDPAFSMTDENIALQKWVQQFDHHCHQQRFTTIENFVSEITTPLNNVGIILTGFTDIPPLYKTLFEKLNTPIHFYENEQSPETISRISFKKLEDEISVMARWAESEYEKGKRKIACIVPTLTSIRPRLQKIFEEQFQDKNLFNLAAGIPLIEYPLIHDVFSIFKLYKKNLPYLELMEIMLSPFIGRAELEKDLRLTLEMTLRDKSEYEVSIAWFISKTQDTCPELHFYLSTFLESSHEDLKSPTQWASYFSEQLIRIGWPGEKALNSEEYQLFHRFQALLDEFASLSIVLPQISFETALQQLKKMCEETIFQKETEDGPIQILGILEAAGIEFDAIWMMGMSQDVWPQPARSNPWIPYSIQRMEQLPHATAARELEFSQKLTDTFLKSSNTIIFSFTEFLSDQQTQISPLLNIFPEMTADSLHLAPYHSIQEIILRRADKEPYEDFNAPRLDTNEIIQGGTAVLEWQSLCPFHAYAAFRLNAKRKNYPTPGLNGAERGFLLHEVLETLWKNIRTHEKLCTFSEFELKDVVSNAVMISLEKLRYSKKNTLNKAFFELEKQRMIQLVLTWMALEKERPPFQVLSVEKKSEIEIGQLKLHIRIDRIDVDEDNNQIMIDYKTNHPNIAKWFEERLSEVQLPLYTIHQKNISGLMFAQIRANQKRFLGVSKHDTNISGVKVLNDFDAQCQHWENQILLLADDFQKGHAMKDPKDGSQTCDKCDLHGLCRIY